MKLKKGDLVKIISGKDKGKTGKVIQAMPSDHKVVVDGVNLRTRFQKSKQGKPGNKVVFPAPMSSSKAMLVDPSSGKPTRVGFDISKDIKSRVAKASGKSL